LQSVVIAAGNGEGTIRVLLDAGTLTFRAATAGLPDGDGFHGYRSWKTGNTCRFVE